MRRLGRREEKTGEEGKTRGDGEEDPLTLSLLSREESSIKNSSTWARPDSSDWKSGSCDLHFSMVTVKLCHLAKVCDITLALWLACLVRPSNWSTTASAFPWRCGGTAMPSARERLRVEVTMETASSQEE